MDYKLINKISKIIPSQELKEHLLFGEYEDALEIVMDLAEGIVDDEIDGEVLFKIIYNNIENKNIDNLVAFTNYIINYLYLGIIESFIIRHISEDFSDTTEYFNEITFLNYYSELEQKDISKFYNNLMALRYKKYEEVEVLEKAFSLDISFKVGEGDPRLPYVNALIESNRLWIPDIITAIIDDDYDSLMKKIKINVCLDNLYFKFREPELDYLQNLIELEKSRKLKKE